MNPRELLDRFMTLPQNQRFLVVGGVLVFIFLIFIYFSYLPARGRAKNLQTQLTRLKSEMMKKQRLAAELDKFKKEVEELKKQLEEAKQILPEKADVSTLLKEISTRASEAGVTVISFQPKGENPKGFYAENNYDLVIEGGFHDIATFIDLIARTKRILTIKDVTLRVKREAGRKKVKAGKKGVKLEAKMTLIAYRFVSSPAAAQGPVQPIRRPRPVRPGR